MQQVSWRRATRFLCGLLERHLQEWSRAGRNRPHSRRSQESAANEGDPAVLTKPGTSTFTEIMEQPAAWREVLSRMASRREEISAWLKAENFGQILLVGCGTS